MVAGKLGRMSCSVACSALAATLSLDAAAQETLRPRADRWEVGFLADTLFISRFHNLKEQDAPQYEFTWPAVLVGGRLGYYPERFLGLETEAAFGYGKVGKRRSQLMGAVRGPDDLEPPRFITARAQMALQLPLSRFVPFALLGGGILNAKSTEMGGDSDLLFELGIGAKYFVSRHIIPRLDLRLDMTQREGGGLDDGVALHGEVMLAIGVNFGVR